MAEKEAHSEKTPQDNLKPFLIRVYQQHRLHMVMFKTTLPEVWMIVIRSRITINLSLQLTKKCGVKEIFTISLSGSEEELKCFCKDFDLMNEEVLKNMQAGGAVAQENQQGRHRMVMSHREVWKRVIQKSLTVKVAFQSSTESGENDLAIQYESVKEVELFYEVFDQMYEEVMTIIQGDAAAQGNPEDDVEQLREGIMELELKKLQKK